MMLAVRRCLFLASLILSGASGWSTVPILMPSDAITSMCSAIWPHNSTR